MKRWWEQLKPLERRWAVAIGGVVFLLLNYFFIWPHRHDLDKAQGRIALAEKNTDLYAPVVAKKSVYEGMLRRLTADGSEVALEDQAVDMVRFYNTRMLSNQVLLLNGGNISTHTNQFFVDQQLGISVQANETNLVNFLFSLGEGSSMVRVRAMNLHPSPDRHELNAGITMVASYQKKVPLRTASGTTPAKATAKPATTTPAQNAPKGPATGTGAGPRPAGQTNKVISAISRQSPTNKPGPPPNIKRP